MDGHLLERREDFVANPAFPSKLALAPPGPFLSKGSDGLSVVCRLVLLQLLQRPHLGLGRVPGVILHHTPSVDAELRDTDLHVGRGELAWAGGGSVVVRHVVVVVVVDVVGLAFGRRRWGWHSSRWIEALDFVLRERGAERAVGRENGVLGDVHRS